MGTTKCVSAVMLTGKRQCRIGHAYGGTGAAFDLSGGCRRAILAPLSGIGLGYVPGRCCRHLGGGQPLARIHR